MSYTICRLNAITKPLYEFIKENIPELNTIYGGMYDPMNTRWWLMISKGVFLVAMKDGKVVGIHSSYLSTCIFNPEIKILQQLLFYVVKGHSKATYLLFNKFIDIGKDEANHINTMLTGHTNIKPESLKRYGFNELETLYRMEV